MSETSSKKHCAGRGSGSNATPPPPPGAPSTSESSSVEAMLRAIQTQMTLQTNRMGQLAEKSDVRSRADKVEGLSAKVTNQGREVEEIKRAHETGEWEG